MRTGTLLLLVALLSATTGHDYEQPALPTPAALALAMRGLSDTAFAQAATAITAATAAGPEIPKLFWVTMKHVHKLPNIREVADRHPKWLLTIVDDANMNRFFDVVYANTSMLWAFKAVHPAIGAAKADLFRYAVLYAFGGVYFDADTTFAGNLDEYIKPTDRFVWASEGNPMGDCYQPWYPLSKTPSFNSDRSILQWMLMSAPQVRGEPPTE